MELVEQSLDYNLTSNCIRYKFQDAPVLEGLSIHESHNHVVVLVTTVSSVHRFDFPHPDKFNRQVIILFHYFYLLLQVSIVSIASSIFFWNNMF